MVRLQFFALVLVVAGMSGCGIVDTAARAPAPFAGQEVSDAIENRSIAPRKGYVVSDLRIDVPRDLRVSEANVYYPFADIVWRGDPYGDHYAQVEQIFRDSFTRAIAALQDGPPVIAEVEVHRFHALTEKARYTIGGVHSVRFSLTLRDAATGAVLDGPRTVKADMRASGGAKALAEEAIGYTQRVALTRHLAGVLADELSLADPPLPPATPQPPSDMDMRADRPLADAAGSATRGAVPVALARATLRPRHRPVN